MIEDDCWIGFLTESIACGSKSFIEEVKRALDSRRKGSASQRYRIIINLEKMPPHSAAPLCRDPGRVTDQMPVGSIPMDGGKFLKRLIFISKIDV